MDKLGKVSDLCHFEYGFILVLLTIETNYKSP